MTHDRQNHNESVMELTRDPLCTNGHGDALTEDCSMCDLLAKVRADERAKYVLPDLPRGGEHVDWCRDLACYGCEEIADGVIAQDV